MANMIHKETSHISCHDGLVECMQIRIHTFYKNRSVVCILIDFNYSR